MTHPGLLLTALVLACGGACGAAGPGSAVHPEQDVASGTPSDGPHVVDAGAGDAAPLAPALSFNVTAKLTLNMGLASITETFVVNIDEPNDRLVISWRGRAANVAFHMNGSDMVSNAKFTLVDPCLAPILRVTTFVMSRSGDGVVGTITGDRTDASGQTPDGPFTSAFTGVRDTTSPHFDYCWFEGHTIKTPTDYFRYMLSEPLPAGVVVRLVGDDGSVIPFVPEDDSEPSAGFTVAATLGFGRSYQLEINPFVDLAGHPGDPSTLPQVTTPALGFALEDGFETDWPRVTTAGVQVVTAGDQWPPLDEARLLVIPAGGAFTARYRVLPGDKTLRMTARPIMPAAFDSTTETFNLPMGYISFGAPAGKLTERELPIPLSPYDTVMGTQFGASATISFNLPSGVIDELIVTVYTDGGSASEKPGPGVLLDDVRVE